MLKRLRLPLLLTLSACSPERALPPAGLQLAPKLTPTSSSTPVSNTSTPPLADLQNAKRIVTTLASPEYWGRGYLYDGMGKAARFIANELRLAGVQPLVDGNYFQNFSYSINTFPGNFHASLNGTHLQPGVDFIITADSSGRSGTFALTQNPSKDLYTTADQTVRVKLVDKLTFAARQRERVIPTTEIQIDRKKFAGIPQLLDLDIQSVIVPDFPAANVTAMVRGTKTPDQYLVMSAHYDHLGGFSNTAYFPGANDNASGTAFLLEMAKYYQSHPQPYTTVFLFFAGEEAGLVGSKFFADHPQIPLSKIRFLFNFDMVGTGDDGATVVNSTVFKDQFKILKDANTELRALPQLGERGEAQSSDHYSFYVKGVPCFFLYTTGGTTAYHDVFDRAETLPFTRFQELFGLIVRFNERLANLKLKIFNN